MPDTFGWDAGADARDPFNWCSGQHSGNRRGRRGVANAHFSGGQQGDTFFRFFMGHVDAHLHAGQRFFSSHGGAFTEVACRVDDLAPDKPLGTADIALYAHIHYGQASPSIAAEGVDRTSALEEVADLNFGHFLPGGAHALEGDVVVGGEQNHGFLGEGWACPPGYPGKADGEFLKLAEASGDFRKAVEPFFHGLRGLFRIGGNRQVVHHAFLCV